MQSVCCMYQLQHDEGRVEEIQEMTGAKLMSVSRGNCNLSSIEKPTVMITNSAKARFPNKRYSEHLERNE